MAASSEFARAQLIKYGWKEGKGLGKHETGIASAIKPKLKFNKHGIGHDSGLEYKSFWWDQIFNQAASNVIVNNADNEVSIRSLDDISKHKKRKCSNAESKSSPYKMFVKCETMHNYCEISNVPKSGNECDATSTNPHDSRNFNLILNDDIFKRCGGRTAHKAARYGHGMNAKLIRLQKQEESFAGLKNIKKAK